MPSGHRCAPAGAEPLTRASHSSIALEKAGPSRRAAKRVVLLQRVDRKSVV